MKQLMRLAFVFVCTGAVLAACGKPAPMPKADLIKTNLAECGTNFRPLWKMANSQAVDPIYADQAKTAARLCRDARDQLTKAKAPAECVLFAESLEELYWQMSAAFNGKADFTQSVASLPAGGVDSCYTAAGIALPTPTPQEQAAAAAAAEATRAAQEAEAAADRAMSAATKAQDEWVKSQR